MYAVYFCVMCCTGFARGRGMLVSSHIAFLRIKVYKTRYPLSGTILNNFFKLVSRIYNFTIRIYNTYLLSQTFIQTEIHSHLLELKIT